MARIMVVEDERELISLYNEIMEVFGHEMVAAVNDGEEAIIEYKKLDVKPDLIILDHRMPVRNGLETAREILNMDPDEKIIFISADPSVKDAAMEIGVLDFLEKPFGLNKLKETIDMVLQE